MQRSMTTGLSPSTRAQGTRKSEGQKTLQGSATNHLQLEANGPAPLPRIRGRAVNLDLYPFDPGLHLIELPGPPPVPSRGRSTT